MNYFFKTKIQLLILIIGFSPILLMADKIDSLRLELGMSNLESSKVGILNKLSEEWLTKNVDSSIFYANTAYDLATKINESDLFTTSLINLSNAYRQAGLYEQGIELIYGNINAKPVVKNPIHKANLLMSLGELNRISAQYDEAIKNIKEALSIYKILEDHQGQAKAHNRLAANFYKLKKLFVAISHADTSIQLAAEYNDKLLGASNYEILGEIYNYLDERAKALNYLNKALDIAKKENDILLETNVLTSIGLTYFSKSNYDSSIYFARQAYALAMKINHKSQIETNAHYLAKAYALKNNYKLAHFYSEIAEEIRMEIYYNDRDQQISKLNRRYQYEKQQQEIENQRFELEIKENELNRKQLLNFLLISWIVVLFILFGFLNASQRKLKRINTILGTKNNLIEEQNRKIEEQVAKYKSAYEKLKDLDQYKEAMTHMLVHDLKNPLNVLINIPELGDFEEKDEVILHTSKQMLTLVMNMLDIQKFENKRMELNRMLVPVSKVLKESIADVQFSSKHKNIKLETYFDKDYILYIDKSLIVRIFVNLFTNAIKHSPANSTIDIIVEETDEQYVLIKVKDNGSGIALKEQEHIFEKYYHKDTKSFDGARSTGLGLTFCKMAVEAHDCEIGVISEKNMGATFWFTLPFRLKK